MRTEDDQWVGVDKFNERQNLDDAALYKRLRSATVDTRIDPFR